MVQPIPEGYHSVTPYLVLRGGARALDFYKAAFGATEVMRMPGEEDKVMHAEIKIGDSHVMLADEFPEMGFAGPETHGGTSVSLMLYVEDCDAVFAQALAAGATELRPMADQPYGDRSGTLKDPFGHVWTVGTHKEDLTPDEIAERMSGGA